MLDSSQGGSLFTSVNIISKIGASFQGTIYQNQEQLYNHDNVSCPAHRPYPCLLAPIYIPGTYEAIKGFRCDLYVVCPFLYFSFS